MPWSFVEENLEALRDGDRFPATMCCECGHIASYWFKRTDGMSVMVHLTRRNGKEVVYKQCVTMPPVYAQDQYSGKKITGALYAKLKREAQDLKSAKEREFKRAG